MLLKDGKVVLARIDLICELRRESSLLELTRTSSGFLASFQNTSPHCVNWYLKTITKHTIEKTVESYGVMGGDKKR